MLAKKQEPKGGEKLYGQTKIALRKEKTKERILRQRSRRASQGSGQDCWKQATFQDMPSVMTAFAGLLKKAGGIAARSSHNRA